MVYIPNHANNEKLERPPPPIPPPPKRKKTYQETYKENKHVRKINLKNFIRRIRYNTHIYIYTLQKKKRIAHFTPFFFYFNEIAVSINVHDLNVIM